MEEHLKPMQSINMQDVAAGCPEVFRQSSGTLAES